MTRTTILVGIVSGAIIMPVLLAVLEHHKYEALETDGRVERLNTETEENWAKVRLIINDLQSTIDRMNLRVDEAEARRRSMTEQVRGLRADIEQITDQVKEAQRAYD